LADSKRALVRVAPKGGDKDTLEEAKWVPKGALVEELTGFGAPWLYTTCECTIREGYRIDPLPGGSCALLGYEGMHYVGLVKLRDLAENELPLDCFSGTLDGWEDTDASAKFCKESILWAELGVDDVMYVPYGYSMFYIAGKGKKFNTLLKQPIVSTNLAKTIPDDISELIFPLCLSYVKDTAKSDFILKCGSPYKAWL
jgi:hypothetical protein